MFDAKTRTIVVVGAQWGDEGKGKLVDVLAERADWVVRYQGGANAGHTVHVGNVSTVLHQVPSGILHSGVRCAIGNGVVLDPESVFDEVDALVANGVDVTGRLYISDRAQLVMPYHKLVDKESAASKAIGTTGRGIGPCYEDKVARRGIRVLDLRHPARLKALVERGTDHANHILLGFGSPKRADAKFTLKALERIAPRLLEITDDVGLAISRAQKQGAAVLLEGAQGSLLDVDHGTYPFVTSSSAVAGGATTGAGIGPSRIDCVVGITKAYTTRVGAGPFPTELDDAAGKHLRDVGVEFGSVTGRPRRTGWLDLPALRYARRVNGLDGLALTKLDVLTGLERVRVCVAYDTPEGRVDDLPIDLLDPPGLVTPVYEDLEGWTEPLSSARSLDDLPKAARAYVRFLEQGAGAPLYLVSVGPRRAETIELRHPFAKSG